MEQQSSRGRGLFIRWTFILGLGMLGALAAGPARAWDPTAPAPPEDFSAFNRRFSSDLYSSPRHGAALGPASPPPTRGLLGLHPPVQLRPLSPSPARGGPSGPPRFRGLRRRHL